MSASLNNSSYVQGKDLTSKVLNTDAPGKVRAQVLGNVYYFNPSVVREGLENLMVPMHCDRASPKLGKQCVKLKEQSCRNVDARTLCTFVHAFFNAR